MIMEFSQVYFIQPGIFVNSLFEESSKLVLFNFRVYSLEGNDTNNHWCHKFRFKASVYMNLALNLSEISKQSDDMRNYKDYWDV